MPVTAVTRRYAAVRTLLHCISVPFRHEYETFDVIITAPAPAFGVTAQVTTTIHLVYLVVLTTASAAIHRVLCVGQNIDLTLLCGVNSTVKH